MYLVILAPWCYMGSPKNQFDINNKIFQNDHIDIDIFQIGLLAINIFKISSSISIFCPYQYFQNKCRYFNNISKNVDLLTININISSKKHEKTLKLAFLFFLPKMSLSILIFSKIPLLIKPCWNVKF